ncbi:prolyl 4-hydroxylase subunit alpha-1 [Lucilia sericata]|uniref:prolyl 4-hydroxylase subunit alpha-1 n=1 Tax=Lucilia sericata TaxID=13632 RepID=UPI0018A84041|nr:prolyl 4-hydroxylase subunit alpha-1 [Lucilia sericata]XP_037812180.1 prolyl 4-hydroxylase subunit alpha-1 [Lucilia sericata]
MKLNTTTKATEATRKTRPRLLIPLSYFCCLWFILFSFFSCRCCLMANAEFYSSVDSLKVLGNMEATLIQNFRQYLKQQQQDIDNVQRFIKEVKFHHELAIEDVADYIENPINAFTLIKRVVNDWKELYEFLKFSDIKMDIEESLTQFEGIQLPNDDELQGAIRGLKRLQTIYKLSADDMAKGEKYGNPLNWRDCFEIGTTLLDDTSFKLAIEWLELSLQKLLDSEESTDIKSAFNKHIKEYLSFAYQGLGETEIAIEYLDDLLESDPDSNVKITKNIILNTETDVDEEDESTIDTNYARLCRGEILKKLPPMNCKLDFKRHPLFALAPLQIEPILENPPVTLYHNLINDEQISKLLSETRSKMQRSQVVSGNGTISVERRVSQQTWVDPQKSKIANLMYKLVGAISGFDLDNAESMQVANYGIGGQYEAHHDYLGQDYESRYDGDRISTNMFYLADVEEGGYTVFPYLDIYSKPIKGSMIMWYNLHKSLDEDVRTLHAGCPVLKGSKKIANVWTHSGYQEFRRPCDLKNDSIM